MGKPVVLLEEFSVAEWFRAITTYRMTRTAVQPAVIRMILDADIPREDLSSLEFIASGSGPLDPDTRGRIRAALSKSGAMGIRSNGIRRITVRMDAGLIP